MKTELDILQLVDHPNVIKLYETYEDSKCFHIVMEYCSGGELFEKVIDQGAYNEPQAAIIIHKILSAINHLHERNMVHRDLKPENILFEN